jgi:hypothetical protein
MPVSQPSHASRHQKSYCLFSFRKTASLLTLPEYQPRLSVESRVQQARLQTGVHANGGAAPGIKVFLLLFLQKKKNLFFF